MHIQLTVNDRTDEGLIEIALDSSSTITSWLIDYYFTKIYSQQVKSSKQSIQPNNIIGLHDMFIVYQIVHSSSASDFSDLCKKKCDEVKDDPVVDNYNNYLNRCGLKDIIDLLHQCKLKLCMKTIRFNVHNVNSEIDRLFVDYLLEAAVKHTVYDEQTQISSGETKENIGRLFANEEKQVEQTISKNYIKHTLCTYLSLLLDTRNEHALIHCLATPARMGIERRTIVELRRLTKLSKNECLTIYQILLSFLRRKELLLSRLSSSQPDSTSNDDESFVILDKYYGGIKEFFDFIEQLQMTIEENEHLKVESIVTFRKLMALISKQLRKDVSFSRCETIFKEIIDEFCECFQATLPLTSITSPVRSASSGGTLAGRRFLRSVAYLCAKQTIHLPILLPTNDHYDSPSTGLRKATSFRLLRSPLTPIPMVSKPIVETPVEDKPADTPVESVFMWQKKPETEPVSTTKRFRKRKSQRCLDLSTIDETSSQADSLTNHSTDSSDKMYSSSGSTRQPLGEIGVHSFNSEKSQTSLSLSLSSESDKENASTTNNKRPMIAANVEQPRKKQKKTTAKVQIAGQKSITNFFRSKS